MSGLSESRGAGMTCDADVLLGEISQSRSAQTRSLAPYYVRALALGIPAYLIGVHFWTWVYTLPLALGGFVDFRHLYTAGYMLRNGYAKSLYDYALQYQLQNEIISPATLRLPFNHLAYEGFLFIPFSHLSYRSAYFAFLVFNLSLLGLSFWCLRPWMKNLAQTMRWLPMAMFLAFLPIGAALIEGQDSLIMLTLLAFATVAIRRGWPLAAGILVGLGIFKFQIVIPIALVLLAVRRFRFAAGFALSASAAVWLSCATVGSSQAMAYLRSLLLMSESVSANDHSRYSMPPALMPNLRGLVFSLSAGEASSLCMQGLTLGLSLVLLVWTIKRLADASDLQVLLAAVALSVPISYHIFIYDLSILLLPVLVMMDRFINAENDGELEERLRLWATALVFTAPLLISWSTNYFFLAAIPVMLFTVSISGARERKLQRPMGW